MRLLAALRIGPRLYLSLVLLGLVPQREAIRGYYHGGLTLHEEHDDRLPHVAFKIDSRYLEHTLTRDNVIRDESYDKAMAIVARLAKTTLVEAVFRELEDGASRPQTQTAALEELRARLAEWLAGGLSLEAGLLERPIVPTISGEPISLARCRAESRRGFWLARERSVVTDALAAQRALVLRGAPDGMLAHLVEVHTRQRPRPVTSVCTAVAALLPAERACWEPLRRALNRLLAARGAKIASIELGHLAYPESPVANWIAITQGKLGELTPVVEIGRVDGGGWLSSGRVVVLNADHPTLARLLELGEHEPELAAYLVLRLFYLHSEQDPDELDRMALEAAEARWHRSTT